jgi:group I intron endonuclease
MTRAEERMYHYIYKVTCVLTQKFYIGMHSTDNLEDGYKGSGKLLWYSIRKYGWNNHKFDILEFLPNRKCLSERERIIVNEEMLDNIKCLNLKIGGDGGGNFKDDDHQKKCSSAGGKVGGKIAGKLNGRLNFQKGHQTMKENGTLFTRGMLGKLHSAESKLKMSESGSGRNNSQFGSRWMTKSGSLVKVKSHEIQSFLDQGFSFGRK